MGAHSTQHITKEAALSRILLKVTTASDEELENIMFQFFGDEELYNYRIVENPQDYE